MTLERLIICAPNRNAVHSELALLDIPANAFLRRDVWVVTPDQITMDNVRGVGHAAWTTLPRYEPGERARLELAATTRTRDIPFHVAVARFLAHKVYHAC